MRRLQAWPQQAAIRAGGQRVHVDHELLAGGADHLHVDGRSEAAIGHLHHPRLRIGGGGARLFRLFALLAGRLLALLALGFHLVQGVQRRRDALGAFARRAFLGCAHALVAGIGVLVDLALEPLHQIARHRKMLFELATAAERGRPRARAHPHPILRQRAHIDHPDRTQGRYVLRQQPVVGHAVEIENVGEMLVVVGDARKHAAASVGVFRGDETVRVVTADEGCRRQPRHIPPRRASSRRRTVCSAGTPPFIM